MCMEEFVKKLYDFRGIIEFFGVKIVIGLSKTHCDLILTVGFDLSKKKPIFTDIYRYISDIYRYFFRNSSTCAHKIKSRNFAEISGISDYQLAISFRDRPITDISAIFRPKKPKLFSLIVTDHI